MYLNQFSFIIYLKHITECFNTYIFVDILPIHGILNTIEIDKLLWRYLYFARAKVSIQDSSVRKRCEVFLFFYEKQAGRHSCALTYICIHLHIELIHNLLKLLYGVKLTAVASKPVHNLIASLIGSFCIGMSGFA